MAHACALESTISSRSIPWPRRSGGSWSLLGRVWHRVAPPIDPAHPNLAAQDQATQQQLRHLRGGQRPLRLHPPAELPIDPLNRVGGPQRLPLTPREAGTSQQVLAGFLEALGHLGRSRAPCAEKRP